MNLVAQDYLGILALFFGMLLATYGFHFVHQKSADWRIKEIEKKCASMKTDLENQVKEAAEKTRKIREEDKHEFENTLSSHISKYQTKINSLDAEVASLSRECEDLRIGRLAFQRELAESKQTIETLRGELTINSIKYLSTIDALQLEVDSLRKQLKEQKKKHDTELEDMRNDLSEKMSKKRGNVNVLALRRGDVEDEEKMFMQHILANEFIRQRESQAHEHSQFDDSAKDVVVAKKSGSN